MESDEELMQAVARSDERALRTLVHRHAPRLHGFLVRMSGDPDVADDLLQETWLRVVRHAPRFDARRRFRPWAYGIAANLARDAHRRSRVRTGEGTAPAEAEPAAPAPDPVEAREVRARLAALDARLRAPLLLRYYEGLDEGEIAAALGIPRGTVKSRIHAAVRALREAYGEEARS